MNVTGLTFPSYAPGEVVPHPGVYAVLHGKPHVSYGQLFVDNGIFPRCSVCGAQVTFRLLQAVENISYHCDFGSLEKILTRKAA
jgi:hypothetical protein